jgi:drug/metabolite transporter (DMT)-like permease
VCFGSSPVLIKKGLQGLPSPLWGVSIGLAAAAMTSLVWLIALRRSQLRPLRWSQASRPIRAAIGFQVLAGVCSALGGVGRTAALDVAPVVVVVPLVQLSALFTIIIAPMMLGRQIERVPPRLVLGTVLVVLGAGLVVLGFT